VTVRRRLNRRERSWREVAKIVGAGVQRLPEFFRNGLYGLTRAGLPDPEIILAFKRCRAWTASAKKNGYGECECGCGTKLPVNAVNVQRKSIWHLDHDRRTKTFRGILYQKCNRQVGSGDRVRKLAHFSYVESHAARLQEPHDTDVADEFQKPGAMPD